MNACLWLGGAAVMFATANAPFVLFMVTAPW